MKLQTGLMMNNFTFDTPYANGIRLKDAVTGKRTAIVFLRYYGCPLCQYDMHLFAKGYSRIAETGGQLFIVLQSSPEQIRQKVAPGQFPFPIICDPDRQLYKAFDIHPAPSKDAMLGGNLEEKAKGIRAMGLTHGEYEGEELQLPAAFVVKGDLELIYVRYGENIADVPTVEELLPLLSSDYDPAK